jgi:hypothetical protein
MGRQHSRSLISVGKNDKISGALGRIRKGVNISSDGYDLEPWLRPPADRRGQALAGRRDGLRPSVGELMPRATSTVLVAVVVRGI